MKKSKIKELLPGLTPDNEQKADGLPSNPAIANTDVVCRLSDVMQKLGEVHNMLARTTLSKEEYNPISNLFAVAKVELFNIYYDLKNEI